jgi:hypothetical protein
MADSPFADDWRDCLREQYKHVVREDDKLTKPSLALVLNQVGFGEDELRELEVRATIRADDLPEDFQPDLQVLEPSVQAHDDFQPHPLECQCPSCMEIDLTPHDADGQPIVVDPEQAATEDAHNDDDPQQLSMF